MVPVHTCEHITKRLHRALATEEPVRWHHAL